TNDAPVIGVAQLTGSVTEDLQGHETGSETTSGTIAFTDADLTDVHLVSAVFKSTDYAGGQLGSLTAVKTTDTTGSGTGGLLTWTFTATDAALNPLAGGQTVHETYTVTLIDQNGGVVTRDVTVTITGTDDAFVIAPGRTLDLKLQPNHTLAHPLIENDGTIVSGSNVPNFIIAGAITGTGLIFLSNNTTLTIEGAVGSGQTVQFQIGQGVPPVLVLTDPSEFHGTISGF